MLRMCLIIIIINHLETHVFCSVESDAYIMPDYDTQWTKKPDLRTKLEKKFYLKKKNDAKYQNIKESIANDTEYFDDIAHLDIFSATKIKRGAEKFEESFKKIIGMVGVTYLYKRDLYWRTWREVTFPKSDKKVICYRCQHVLNGTENNCTDCYIGGYWAIEDKAPSCSYEILSFRNHKELCVAKYWQLNKNEITSCPTTIPFGDLSFCHMPMVTKLRVTPDYSKKVSERAFAVICPGREICEFSTFYKIKPNIISFRIINSTNDIIYSRIMKDNGKNYACIEDCGHIDFDTMEITRKEKHLVLNLLRDYPQKRKREHPLYNILKETNKGKKINRNSTWRTGKIGARSLRKEAKRVHNKLNNRESKGTERRHNLFVKRHKYVTEQPFFTEYTQKTTLSHCRRMFLSGLANDDDK